MGIDQRIRVQEKIFFIEKGVVDCREGGDCWVSSLQVQCIFITLRYHEIEIENFELSSPPPTHPLPFALATRSAHAVNVNARDDSNRWVIGIFPFFSFCVYEFN